MKLFFVILALLCFSVQAQSIQGLQLGQSEAEARVEARKIKVIFGEDAGIRKLKFRKGKLDFADIYVGRSAYKDVSDAMLKKYPNTECRSFTSANTGSRYVYCIGYGDKGSIKIDKNEYSRDAANITLESGEHAHEWLQKQAKAKTKGI